MSELRSQSGLGAAHPPIVLNNNNFAKGAPGEPVLLSIDDARTLFHEFGHGLHGMLSAVRYRAAVGHPACCAISSNCPRSCSSTGCSSRPCCASTARHGESGEPIPEALIEKLRRARALQPGL
jgi:peptidyl-dipeptidase Dcp